MKLTVKTNSFIFYFLMYNLLYFSSSYYGGLIRYIYIFYLLLLIFNVTHYLLTINRLFYYQDFSTEHPKKEQEINYKLTVENRMFFTSSYVDIKFNDSINIEESIPRLKKNSTTYFFSDFSLPYRGIYTVGIKHILCKDLLNIFTYKLSFWPRTFYVYPKINRELNTKQSGSGNVAEKVQVKKSMQDEYLNSINNYEPGIKMSKISWKHFASIGEPYIKKFSSEEYSKTNIFLDKTKLPISRKGPVDDLAIEVLISIIRDRIDNNEIVYLNENKCYIKSEADFESLYKKSIMINFDNKESNSQLDFVNQNYNKDEKLIIITTFESSFLLDIEFLLTYNDLIIYVISNFLPDEEVNKLTKIVNKLSDFVDIRCLK